MLRYSYMTATAALKNLNADEHGLTGEEATRRLSEQGANVIEQSKKINIFKLFFCQFGDVMTLLLVAAAAISGVIALISHDFNDLTDTIIIICIILLNAVIGTVQQYRADKAIENLKKLSAPTAIVLRDGREVKLPASQLVVGDIVRLEEGDLVPADCRIISCNQLKTDEAALTGESVAAEKRDGVITDRKTPLGATYNMLFSSTFVVRGNAVALVTGTGRHTQIGAIADMLECEEKGKSPLERVLDKLGKAISLFVVAVAAVIFAFSAFARGEILHSFMTSVAIAVAAIPEGLPAVVTIIMAMGVQRMSRRNVVIRKMKAVETLGGCTCICTDKTGTLTRNKMQVRAVWLPSGGDSSPMFIRCMAECNNARGGVGDPTEVAIKSYAESMPPYGESYIRTGEIAFSSERKMMSVIVEGREGTLILSKGAPDVLIKKCTKIADMHGERDITPRDIELISARNAEMSDRAMRVLGFACGRGKREENLTFLGRLPWQSRRGYVPTRRSCFRASSSTPCLPVSAPKP